MNFIFFLVLCLDRFLPSKKNRICWRLDKQVRKSLMKLIEERRKKEEVLSEECPNDLLEVMIKAGSDDEYRNTITVNDIVEECKTIFFAGKHTTSNLLTWTTILLAMHPKWQELARDEVLTVCGARDPPSKQQISKLKTVCLLIFVYSP